MVPLPTWPGPLSASPLQAPPRPLSRTRGAAPLAQASAHPQHHCAQVTPLLPETLTPQTSITGPGGTPSHWAPFPGPSHQPGRCHPAGPALGPSPLLRRPRCPSGPRPTSVHTHLAGCAARICLPTAAPEPVFQPPNLAAPSPAPPESTAVAPLSPCGVLPFSPSHKPSGHTTHPAADSAPLPLPRRGLSHHRTHTPQRPPSYWGPGLAAPPSPNPLPGYSQRLLYGSQSCHLPINLSRATQSLSNEAETSQGLQAPWVGP